LHSIRRGLVVLWGTTHIIYPTIRALLPVICRYLAFLGWLEKVGNEPFVIECLISDYIIIWNSSVWCQPDLHTLPSQAKERHAAALAPSASTTLALHSQHAYTVPGGLRYSNMCSLFWPHHSQLDRTPEVDSAFLLNSAVRLSQHVCRLCVSCAQLPRFAPRPGTAVFAALARVDHAVHTCQPRAASSSPRHCVCAALSSVFHRR
jgi:hypothetical protein